MDGAYSSLLSGQGVPQGWMSSEPFNRFVPFASNEANMSVVGSSQMEEEHRNVTEGQTNEVMPKKGSRTKNFTEKEDIMLCTAWGSVGMDPVVGTNQSTATYWQRIYDCYHEHKDFPSDQNQRRNRSRRQQQVSPASFSSKKQKSSTTASPRSSPTRGIYVDLDGDTPDGSGKATARPMGTKAAKSLRRRSMSSDRASAMKASIDSINSQIMENEQKRQEMLQQHQKNHEIGLQERHEQHLAAKHKKIEMLRQIEEKKMEQKERLKLIEIEAEDMRRRNEKTMKLEARELDMIMQLDYSKLNDESKKYYEKRKKKLLAKKDLLD